MLNINQGEFGARLKKAIKDSDKTQKEVADKVGISTTSVSNYVNGRIPEAVILYEISKLLNVSIEWLFTGEGNRERVPEENNKENVYELSEDEADFIEKVRQIPKTELKQVRGMLDLKIYEMNQDKKGRSSAYQSGEEAATREKNLA